MKTKDTNGSRVPDVAELTSLVTMSVEDYIAVVEEGFAKAK
jgi:hypothetical protein